MHLCMLNLFFSISNTWLWCFISIMYLFFPINQIFLCFCILEKWEKRKGEIGGFGEKYSHACWRKSDGRQTGKVVAIECLRIFACQKCQMFSPENALGPIKISALSLLTLLIDQSPRNIGICRSEITFQRLGNHLSIQCFIRITSYMLH